MQIAARTGPGEPGLPGAGPSLLENFAWIAAATNHVGPDGISLWDEEDGFFYDVLRQPDGSSIPLKVRSIVGLMPLAAATVIDASVRTEFPGLVQAVADFLARHPAVTAAMPGHGRQRGSGPVLFALFDEARLRRILARMLDEEEFLGPHGIRAVSRCHARASVHLRRERPGVRRRLPAGRVRHRHVRRQLQLARAGVVPDQRDADAGTHQPLRSSSATISRSSARPDPGGS